MNTPTDDHLQEFRTRSDQAFLAMQTKADQEMGKFLQSYSEGATLGSFQTPSMTWGLVADPGGTPSTAGRARVQRPQTLSPQGAPRPNKAEGATPRPSSQAFNDFGQVGDELKQDLAHQAEDAVNEGKGLLRNFGFDLGERAKREAAALRDAARKAMKEENSLRGLKERAQAELQAAKQRITSELADVKQDALEDLEGMAVRQIGGLQKEGFEAAEAAGGLAQDKLDQIFYGAPPEK